MRRMMLVLATLLAACGSEEDGSPATTSSTTTTAPKTVEVRIEADIVGFGCSASTDRSGLDVGNGQRVRVEDGSGEVLGVGTMSLTDGADSCDWTAVVGGVPGDRDFYVVTAGAEVATMDLFEMRQASWRVRVRIGSTGSVTVSPYG